MADLTQAEAHAAKRTDQVEQAADNAAWLYSLASLEVSDVEFASESCVVMLKVACDIYRQLVEFDDTTYKPMLLQSLKALTPAFESYIAANGYMIDIGYEGYCREAKDILRGLMEADPSKYYGEYAYQVIALVRALDETDKGAEREDWLHEAFSAIQWEDCKDGASVSLYRAIWALDLLSRRFKWTDLHSASCQLGDCAESLADSLFGDAPLKLPDAYSITNIGISLWVSHRTTEAEFLYREMLALYRAADEMGQAPRLSDEAHILDSLACHLADLGETEEIESLYREAIAIKKRIAESDPSSASGIPMVMVHLADFLVKQGRIVEATGLHREALDICSSLYETNPGRYEVLKFHHITLMGRFLFDVGRYSEAETYQREALEWEKGVAKEFPSHLSSVATLLGALAETHDRMGASENAEIMREELGQLNAAAASDNRADNVGGNGVDGADGLSQDTSID